MGAGSYRDCAKGGKTSLGGNIKSGSGYHSSPKKMANGGRVKKYADGDEVSVTRTDPFKDDSAGAGGAWQARQDYEGKQAAQKAQESAYSDAGQAQRSRDVMPSAAASGSAMAEHDAQVGGMGGATAAAPAAAPSAMPAQITTLTDAEKKATLDKAGVKPAKSEAQRKMQKFGAAVATALGGTTTFRDQPSGRADSAPIKADNDLPTAGEEGESGWDKTPMGRGWKSVKKAFSGSGPSTRPGMGGGARAHADGGKVQKVKKA